MIPAATKRSHPFGRSANWLVLGGASLGVIQSVVLAMAAITAPVRDEWMLEGGGLLVWLLIVLLLTGGAAWLCIRAVRAWWARSLEVERRLYVAGGLLVPLGLATLDFQAWFYVLAGLLLVGGGLAARSRIRVARAEDRGGPR